MVIGSTTWPGLVPVFWGKGFIVYNSLVSVASWRVPNSLYGCSWMASGIRQMASCHTDNLPLTQTSGECPCPNLQMRKSRSMWSKYAINYLGDSQDSLLALLFDALLLECLWQTERPRLFCPLHFNSERYFFRFLFYHPLLNNELLLIFLPHHQQHLLPTLHNQWPTLRSVFQDSSTNAYWI